MGDRIVITPTGGCLGTLREEDLAAIDFSGSLIGAAKPSKEWRMHLSCYRRADVNAVFHVHSIYSVAISCLKQIDLACAMPIYTPGYAVRVGRLPAVPYLPAGSAELAEKVGDVIATRDSVLLANHGVLAVGSSFAQAFNCLDEIESNARLHAILAGRGTVLDDEQVALLRSLY
jgi:3-dehydro-4-phosphotetronate decarboxylase